MAVSLENVDIGALLGDLEIEKVASRKRSIRAFAGTTVLVGLDGIGAILGLDTKVVAGVAVASLTGYAYSAEQAIEFHGTMARIAAYDAAQYMVEKFHIGDSESANTLNE